MQLNKLILGMSSKEYHETPGTFSSTQLKTMLEDEELFYKKYISREIEREVFAAFEIGSYFHTGVLEPHLLSKDCIVFDGVRRGLKWETFQRKHKGKAIVIPSEMEKANGLIKAVQDSPVAMHRIKNGKPEVSVLVKLLVTQGEIYAPDFKKVLKKTGWEKVDWNIPKGGVELLIKCRADLLGDTYILDLKSTGGNAKSDSFMKSKVTAYQYDLSAALYLDIFNLVKKGTLNEFIWTFASKDMFNSKSYVASPDNIRIGRIKWMKAIFKLAYFMENDWAFHDTIGVLEPSFQEREYLKEQDHDLL